MAAGTVAIKLRYADFTTLTRQMSLAVPTDDEQEIYRAARVLLDRAWQQGRPCACWVWQRGACPPRLGSCAAIEPNPMSISAGCRPKSGSSDTAPRPSAWENCHAEGAQRLKHLVSSEHWRLDGILQVNAKQRQRGMNKG